MVTIKNLISFSFLGFLLFGFAQTKQVISKDSIRKAGFKEYYPIHVKPSLSYLSSMYEGEDILFDAKPTAYYSIHNDMRFKMENFIYKPSYALYLTFQPHIRMYNENSKPVKTPSYKLLLGGQVLIKTRNDDFLAIALETGHYSNGQSGCAFGEGLEDESAECIAVHQTITNQSDLSELLNRTNGNFSTNLTNLMLSYRMNWFDEENTPFKALELSGYWTWYHNNLIGLIDIGGYTPFDIAIYGRHRFGLGAEFMHNFLNKFRYTASLKTEYISGSHPFVEPWRIEANYTIYPFNGNLGVFISYITGHDNYNFRFVDSGNQFSLGITWDWFAPFEIKRSEILKDNLKSKQL